MKSIREQLAELELLDLPGMEESIAAAAPAPEESDSEEVTQAEKQSDPEPIESPEVEALDVDQPQAPGVTTQEADPVSPPDVSQASDMSADAATSIADDPADASSFADAPLAAPGEALEEPEDLVEPESPGVETPAPEQVDVATADTEEVSVYDEPGGEVQSPEMVNEPVVDVESESPQGVEPESVDQVESEEEPVADVAAAESPVEPAAEIQVESETDSPVSDIEFPQEPAAPSASAESLSEPPVTNEPLAPLDVPQDAGYDTPVGLQGDVTLPEVPETEIGSPDNYQHDEIVEQQYDKSFKATEELANSLAGKIGPLFDTLRHDQEAVVMDYMNDQVMLTTLIGRVY